MTGSRGFTLIEVVVVMAIIAIALGLAGPRIGAGIGRLELNQASQTVHNFIKLARLQAQRSDRTQYVVLDKGKHVVELVAPEMTVLRKESMPSTVDFLFDAETDRRILYVSPSGLVRGESVRLRGRVGEVQVELMGQ